MAGMQSRQSVPAGPPAPFDPNRRPAGSDNVAASQEALQQEHIRLRPEERFRAPISPGSPVMSTIPPMPAPGAAKGLGEHIQKLTNYPAWRYHATKCPTGIIVSDPDDEKRRTPEDQGWSKLPPPKIKSASLETKLELLESLIEEIAQSGDPQPNESPLECLERIIEERNDFARKYTALSEARKGKKNDTE